LLYCFLEKILLKKKKQIWIIFNAKKYKNLFN
jgi:hypothetical protein